MRKEKSWIGIKIREARLNFEGFFSKLTGEASNWTRTSERLATPLAATGDVAALYSGRRSLSEGIFLHSDGRTGAN